MKKIMSREPVVIPDGRGGVRETIYVDVPAMQDEETGEVFLGDDALGMLDHIKAVRMGGYSIEMNIHPIAAPRSASRRRRTPSHEMAHA